MVERSEVVRHVLDCLARRGPVPGANLEDQLRHDFVGAQLLDSFEIIQMIGEIEGRFGIQLPGEDIVSDQFRTAGGVVDIVMRQLNG